MEGWQVDRWVAGRRMEGWQKDGRPSGGGEGRGQLGKLPGGRPSARLANWQARLWGRNQIACHFARHLFGEGRGFNG